MAIISFILPEGNYIPCKHGVVRVNRQLFLQKPLKGRRGSLDNGLCKVQELLVLLLHLKAN